MQENIEKIIQKISQNVPDSISLLEVFENDESYCYDYGDDGIITYSIKTDRSCYTKVAEYIYSQDFYSFRNELNIRCRLLEREPELVHAEVGQFVLIWSDFMFEEDEESNVGIVSSKIEKDGKFFYSVKNFYYLAQYSEIQLKINNDIDRESYTGFLRVLTKEEFIERLKIKALSTYNTEKDSLERSYNRSLEETDKVVNLIHSNHKVLNKSCLYINEDVIQENGLSSYLGV